MRHSDVCLAALLCLLGACGGEGAREGSAAPDTAPEQRAMTYTECMAAANQQPSRAEIVVKAGECLRLPDAPPPGSTLPPGIPPPPGAGRDTAAGGEISSVYSPLDEAQCRVTEMDEESGSSTSRCPGVAGHVLNVHDGDARVSIDVVTPDGRVHELNYWSVVTGAFSNVGPRAEWRVRGQGSRTRPLALIVRVNASEHVEEDGSNRRVSYLAVAKITARQICVTDRIPPVPDANTLARRAADSSAGRPCRTSY